MLTKKQKYNVAVVGATGIVGEALLNILHSRKFPINTINPIASDKSEGVKIKDGDEEIEINWTEGVKIKDEDGSTVNIGWNEPFFVDDNEENDENEDEN